MRKQRRSLTIQDCVGAFCGGSLGFFLGWAIHPASYPIWCFIGCIVGFFYEELIAISSTSRQETMARFKKTCLDWLVEIKADPTQIIASCRSCFLFACGIGLWLTVKTLEISGHVLSATIKLIPAAFQHFFDFRQSWLVLLYQLCQKHFFIRVATWRIITAISATVIQVECALLYSAHHPSTPDSLRAAKEQIGESNGVGLAIALLFLTLLSALATWLPGMELNKGWRYQLRLRHRHDKRGWPGFALYDIFSLLRMEILLALTVVIGSIVSVTAALICFFAIAPLYACTIFLIKTAKFLVFKSEHMLCASVTIIVTGLTLWYTYSLLNWYVVGPISLSNGLLCCGATLATRRITITLFKRSTFIRQLATLSGSQILDKTMDIWLPGLWGHIIGKPYSRLFLTCIS